MTTVNPPCPFCEIVAGRAPATIVGEWYSDIAITPLNPVTDGHVIVIPRVHVPDATTSANVSGQTMRQAARLARKIGPCNIITSVGAEATQTVMHLHMHIVPRVEGDGLHLPWTGAAHRSPHHHEGRIMTTYHLAVSEQTDTAVRMLAELNTADPAVMAATLRAAADRLDPPQPARPVYRGGEALPPVRSKELQVEYLDDPDPDAGLSPAAAHHRRVDGSPFVVRTMSDLPPPVAPVEVDAARRVVRNDGKAPGTTPYSG